MNPKLKFATIFIALLLIVILSILLAGVDTSQVELSPNVTSEFRTR